VQAPRGYSIFDLFTVKGMRIQVKASRNGCNWLVGQVRPEPTLIYCLVDFEGGDTGTVYVVPSQTVLDATDAFHRCFEDRNLRETPYETLRTPGGFQRLTNVPMVEVSTNSCLRRSVMALPAVSMEWPVRSLISR
jgi:hypothetical protein